MKTQKQLLLNHINKLQVSLEMERSLALNATKKLVRQDAENNVINLEIALAELQNTLTNMQ